MEGSDITGSETNRKRPFESPEPEEHPPPIQTDEVTPTKVYTRGIVSSCPMYIQSPCDHGYITIKVVVVVALPVCCY